LLLILSAVAVAGCAALFVPDDSPSDAERKQIETESAPYTQKGTGSIVGVVSLDTPSGRYLANRGAQVYLTPATTSSLARLQEYGIEKDQLPPSRHADVVWMTTTDSQGRFQFDQLPPGEYIAVCSLTWVPSGNSNDVKNDIAYARFKLGPGEHATVEVTRRADG
jgi:hypothetical protein